MKSKVVIYARFSSHSQTEQNLSKDNLVNTMSLQSEMIMWL